MSIYIGEGEFWESKKIQEIFSLENKMLYMCKIEAAIANADAEMGFISQEDANKINKMVDTKFVDIDIYNEQMQITGGHPVMAFLNTWRKAFGNDPARNSIHFGAATPDIIDNVKLLQLKECHKIISDELADFKDILRAMALQYRDTVMVGRSHHQHAVPQTFGYKVATWLMEIQRQITRLQESAGRLFVVSCYGAVGASNTFGKNGMEFNRLVAKYLDMDWCPVCWQTSRDTEVEYLCDLVSITNTLGKIATELFELSRTEVGEVAEAWAYGNIGSTTMPHKRNPWGLEIMIAIARTCTSQITNEFNCMTQFHERDFMVQHQENFSIPVICSCCEHILQYGIQILGTLEVYPDRMRKNLDMTLGAVMTENVMMHLTKKMDRYTAHHKLYDYSMKAFDENTSIKSLLENDSEIMNAISKHELDEAFEYSSYIGNCLEQVDAALQICI